MVSIKPAYMLKEKNKKKIDFNYEEIFSQVTNESSIKIMLASAPELKYKFLQFDVKCAFLY